jgi:hypothetical protein
MSDSRPDKRARIKGEPIGYATGLAIRLIFLREIDWAPPNLRLKGIRRIEDREMKLHDLARIIDSEKAKPLYTPIASFYRDVTLNEESARRLPIVATCAAPADRLISENIANFAPTLRIQIPGEIRSEWEGKLVSTEIVEELPPGGRGEHGHSRPPLELFCDFVDTMAFFGSGHVAYSVSIILRPDSFPGGEGLPQQKIPVFPAVLLSLLDLARSEEQSSTRASIKFAFVGDSADLKPLDEFISHRLHALANPSDGNKRARFGTSHAPDYCDVFRGIIWPTRRNKGWPKPKDGNETNFASFRFGDLQSATCEIVEFSEFDKLQQYVLDAKRYEAKSDSFGKGLAGLAQNVIDFDDQDSSEVSDSLFYGDNVAGCTDFVSARSTVVFNKQSRAFERMKNFIGGEPYFYFTVLAALYNEFLTNRAANALSKLQPGMLIGASPLKSTKAELESRYEIFVAHLRPMIPNLFRYNVESTLFKKIHERRGIASRQEMIERELTRYETIAHDFEGLNLQRSNAQFNLLVIVLALWSAFGALATAASLFVALHSDAQPERVTETAVDFSRNSAEALMELSFWTAFAGLAVAVVFSLIFAAGKLGQVIYRFVLDKIGRNRSRPSSKA